MHFELRFSAFQKGDVRPSVLMLALHYCVNRDGLFAIIEDDILKETYLSIEMYKGHSKS